jgi:hypothetical protein
MRPMREQLQGRVDRVVQNRSRERRDTSQEARLQGALRDGFAADGTNVGVMVTSRCGAVEVRVFGPRAALTLSFDHADAHLASVRLAVRAALSRYGSALGSQAE